MDWNDILMTINHNSAYTGNNHCWQGSYKA